MGELKHQLKKKRKKKRNSKQLQRLAINHTYEMEKVGAMRK
jgi:hypothetical protein